MSSVRSVDNQAQLIALKKIFDRIEPYELNQSIGFRSLRNIGVWLMAFVLTETSEQESVLTDLAEKAGLEDNRELKEMVSSLATRENIEDIISQYEKAGGKFEIGIQNENAKNCVLEKGKALGLEDLLKKYLTIHSDQSAILLFEMKNEIKFLWASDNPRISARYRTSLTKPFGESKKEIPYLSGNQYCHSIKYTVVSLNNEHYHVAQLRTIEPSEQRDRYSMGIVKNGFAYLIEPFNQSAHAGIQANYLDIISQFGQQSIGAEAYYNNILQHKDKTASLKVKVSEEEDGSVPFRFRVDIHFPELKGPLKTTENRLGIYESFAGKHVGNLPSNSLAYHGERELQYDEEGGLIRNVESLRFHNESAMMSFHTYTTKVLKIEFTVTGPFWFIYAAGAENSYTRQLVPKQADYYPFFIADPSEPQTLVTQFSADKSYARARLFKEKKVAVADQHQPQQQAEESSSMLLGQH
jgi:hypothetical protein